MPWNRRSLGRLVATALTAAVIGMLCVDTVLRRLTATARTLLVAVLGGAVITSVYLDLVMPRAPAFPDSPAGILPARRGARLAATGLLSLAVALVAAGVPAAQVSAASPTEAVIGVAEGYVGTPFRLGAEGPNFFDCSGFVFRIFADAGQLPRIGDKRMRAAGYLRWFRERGLASLSGERGDLVVYGNGSHIGIYLGGDRVISAIIPRVANHGLNNLDVEFTTFLKVEWSVADPGSDGGSGSGGTGKGPGGTGPGDTPPGGETGRYHTPPPRAAAQPEHSRALAVGLLNLRAAAGPDERIIGLVRRGQRFDITATGKSPSGALWYRISIPNGKVGWAYARWVRSIGR